MDEAAKHDCRLPQRLIADSRWSYLACPCGRRDPAPTGKTFRNALDPKRPVSFAMALDVLKLINGATKTQRWRKAWRQDKPPGARDAWDVANGRLMPKYALRAGLMRERAPELTALVTGR